jgi:hypothetical protein
LLVFAIMAFTSIHSMPGWLQGFARVQPIARAANTVRALTEGGPVDTKPFPDRPVEHRHPGRLRPMAVRRYRKG